MKLKLVRTPQPLESIKQNVVLHPIALHTLQRLADAVLQDRLQQIFLPPFIPQAEGFIFCRDIVDFSLPHGPSFKNSRICSFFR